MTDAGSRFVWSAPLPSRRGATMVIREALIPMVLWPSVAVMRRIEQELTAVERFVIEAALALDPMRPEDVEEVTDIPRDAIIRIAGRMTGLGVLRVGEDGYYGVEVPARAALEERAVPEHRVSHLTWKRE
jgi:hypothetical protein